MKSPFVLHQGDCIEIMRGMPPDSIDSCVTDPPYGIRFMGKAWDGEDIERQTLLRSTQRQPPNKDGSPRSGPRKTIAESAGTYDLSPAASRSFQEFSRQWAEQVYRVLKPGGYLLSFASTRTYHRMACGIEDAGFEIRDQMAWMFGSGFPKSHNLGGGYGTALKPAWEPIAVARKPLNGTVAENFREFKTGVMRIDDCRVPVDLALDGAQFRTMTQSVRLPGSGWGMNQKSQESTVVSPNGRWPANIIHDGSDEVVSAFPEAGGAQGAVSGTEPSSASTGSHCFGKFARIQNSIPRGDTGSAARFFYCAKASRAERDEGCEYLPQRDSGMTSENSGQHITRRDGGAPGLAANFHPTVKPIALMRYLCRLVTPVGGTVLDPFVGSGTTGRAAIFEHLQFIGCEREADYMPIARARIADAVGPLFA